MNILFLVCKFKKVLATHDVKVYAHWLLYKLLIYQNTCLHYSMNNRLIFPGFSGAVEIRNIYLTKI